MPIEVKPGLWRTVGLLVAVLLVSACATVRKVTYPPDFVYLPSSEVRSSMAHMSAGIARLDEVLGTGREMSPADRAAVIRILDDLESVAKRISAGGRETNHLLIDQHIDEFRVDLQRARSAVEQTPPNYYFAGRLSGSCLACHIHQRE